MILGTIVVILMGQGPMAQSVVFETQKACEEATARAIQEIQSHPEYTVVLAECRKI